MGQRAGIRRGRGGAKGRLQFWLFSWEKIGVSYLWKKREREGQHGGYVPPLLGSCVVG